MKETCFAVCLCIIYCVQSDAQSILNFTISQSPPLTLNTLRDTVVKKGDSVKLFVLVTGGSGSFTYSWLPVTGLDKPNTAFPTALVDTTTTYTVTVTDPNGCIKSSSVQLKVNTITALDPAAAELGLQIYPTPNNGTFYITTRKALNEHDLIIEVFDPLGKVLYTERVNGFQRLQKKIHLPAAHTGIYFIKLTGEQIKLTQKILVQ
jgi:hypothetical protein